MLRNTFFVVFIFFIRCNGQWTFLAGTNNENDPIIITSINSTNYVNSPGGRSSGAAWYGGYELVWIYGGVSFNDSSHKSLRAYSDLWYYDLSLDEWAFISQSSSGDAVQYGDVNPGARYDFAFWTVNTNKVYVFGGNSPSGYPCDIYSLEIDTAFDTTWTYLSGSSGMNLSATFGPIGTEGASYNPGGRIAPASWAGNDGGLWLLGGQSRLNSDIAGPSNDMWRFNLTTNQWAFMGGSQNTQDPGIYNKTGAWPGSREFPAYWSATNGDFWLFGGSGGGQLAYNDLWSYSNGVWTWVSGDVPSATQWAVYGEKGVGTPSTKPGGRGYSIAWMDTVNMVWVFGGIGYTDTLFGDLQDLWIFNTSSHIWTFVDGNTTVDSLSTYGPVDVDLDIPPSARASPYFLPLIDSYNWIYGGAQLYQNDTFFSDSVQLNLSRISHRESIPTPVTTGGSTTGTTGTSSTTAASEEVVAEAPKKSNAGAIAAGVLVPIVVIAIGAVAAYVWWRNRQFSQPDVPLATVTTVESEKNSGLTGVVIENKLGEGSFGDVYRGMWNDVPVALKMLKDPTQFVEFQKEATLLCSLKHENIVQYFGTFVGNRQFIVTELMTRGDAKNMIMKDASLSTHELVKMCVDAAKGMAFIHSQSIIHRDLALRNLLVTDGPNKSYVVKVSDFGMAKMMEGQDSYYKSATNYHPIKWCAPETLKYGKYSFQSDVWAYGVLVWEVFSQGMPPYPGMNNVQCAEAVLQGYRMGKPENCPDSLFEIVQRCWKESPKERPTMEQIVTDVIQVYKGL